MSRACPVCNTGRLNMYGFFVRKYLEPQGIQETVSVSRVRCGSCRQSFSLLYIFLIPYRRYSVAAFESSVLAYIAVICLYSVIMVRVIEQQWVGVLSSFDLFVLFLFAAIIFVCTIGGGELFDQF